MANIQQKVADHIEKVDMEPRGSSTQWVYKFKYARRNNQSIP